ncbi:hypothetical protein [Suicoccus acidiformans]|nr:hypothetical protein [Suicoccus acidiformans]
MMATDVSYLTDFMIAFSYSLQQPGTLQTTPLVAGLDTVAALMRLLEAIPESMATEPAFDLALLDDSWFLLQHAMQSLAPLTANLRFEVQYFADGSIAYERDIDTPKLLLPAFWEVFVQRLIQEVIQLSQGKISYLELTHRFDRACQIWLG